ncbi:hypothetical protein JD844_031331 [Phrynosoma platyrhinos]|uniref:BPTI/Kunitz inhibitor domain-containing protein n=1 Tax=Phrynosoma platyrhinos TaxID=52577 RepID=A0ABQ7T0J2_PHRPL|nr:hypothetical protein JD844_031331 [Phrynosoma platyrhinos]
MHSLFLCFFSPLLPLPESSFPANCHLLPEIRKCNASLPSFYFDTKAGKCQPFIDGECGRNANNFVNPLDCILECEKYETMPPKCELPKHGGFCRATKLRFYYNSDSGRCEKFYYGGCLGNKNNFRTMIDCLRDCESYDYPFPPQLYPEFICRDLDMPLGPIVKLYCYTTLS